MVHGIVLHLRIYPAFVFTSRNVGLVRVVYILERRRTIIRSLVTLLNETERETPEPRGIDKTSSPAKTEFATESSPRRQPPPSLDLQGSNALQTIGISGFTLLRRTSRSFHRWTALNGFHETGPRPGISH
jgi:hypothetical protein